MEFEVPTIIIGILSFGFAIFLGRKIHPFFYPERKGLRDSFEAGVRLDRKFGNYDGRSEDVFESTKGGGFMIIVLSAFFGSFFGLQYALIKATEFLS
ncbi:hypothetical protein [Pseudoalteromonas sp. SIMBA_162]|uniref:hypothetical protein n=1 Tax=Pseudoalteromonas sp. SIMBA_162 TaxID=3080867 RepID=UPI00397AB54F